MVAAPDPSAPVLMVDLGRSWNTDGLERNRSRPAFAKSPAYETIKRELIRYLNGETRGRSFLVSGHRGAGKTSMVLRVIEDVQDWTLNPEPGENPPPQRPIPVKLHGPTLLEMLQDARSRKSGASDDGNSPESQAMARILSQLMNLVYRELASEAVRGYRFRMDRVRGKVRQYGGVEEAVAQFALALDNAPPPEELREYWRRADALEKGVFWPDDGDETAPPAPGMAKPVPRYNRDSFQGSNELVALSTAAQAYRYISGQYTHSLTTKDSASDNVTVTTTMSPDVKVIADKALGVVTGGLVGGAVLAGGGGGPWLAAAAGLVTAFLSAWTFKYTASRDRKRSRTADYSFIKDANVATLDREMPVVIQRIRQAGLAPVFVVDELDKVDDLELMMTELVRRLKHMVADRFFFCFLTDRDYFEQLERQARELPYPREHTYFSQRLFILYRPDDLRDYLRDVLYFPPGPSDPAPLAPEDDLSPARRDESFLQDNERVLKELVSIWVRYRAKLHVFDLQGELARACNEAGVVQLSEEDFGSDRVGRRAQIMAQLAVEHLLQQSPLKERIDSEPSFGQFAYDALYYALRAWERGEEVLQTTDVMIDDHLVTRLDANTSPPPPSPPVSDPMTAGSPVETPEDAARPETIGECLPELDVEMLREAAREVPELLSQPDLLAERLMEDGILGDLHSHITRFFLREDQALIEKTGDDVWAWKWDQYNRAFGKPDERAQEFKADVEDRLARLRALSELDELLRSNLS
ncbi:MAG: hypothetical protein ACMVY4_12015 [Minwuia sp.]|uniref:hypothetical protein n=1 Tax=Minwuia sp. TaxID=2493630 RepID=UPI003A8C3067